MRTPKNIFQNWNKVCYIRKRIKVPETEVVYDEYGNETINYEDNVSKYYVNYQPVTNDADEAILKPYGITLEGTVKLLLDYKYINKLEKYDLAYIYGANPNNETFIGENANYRVITSIPQNLKILVYFEKI